MTQRSSSLTRAFAVLAVVCGLLALILVISSSLLGDGGGSQGDNGAQSGKASGGAGKNAPATYVVQNGDTLTSIAHDTGVSVARIQALNPGVDPQILISGEKLKLR